MKFGFYTACLPNVDLKKLVKWASNNDFKTLEIACWLVNNDREDYSGSSIDVANLTKEGVGSLDIGHLFKHIILPRILMIIVIVLLFHQFYIPVKKLRQWLWFQSMEM